MQVNDIHALYDNLFFILCKLLNNISSCILLKWLVLFYVIQTPVDTSPVTEGVALFKY